MKILAVSQVVIAFMLVGMLAGCRAKLAESPYGAREQGWEDFIKNTYPDWEPPRTVPPDSVGMEPSRVSPEDVSFEVLTPGDTTLIEMTPLTQVPPAVEAQSYTVQKGDTLWKISRQFYGSGKDWRRIYESNRDVIANPDKVREGAVLRIPAAD